MGPDLDDRGAVAVIPPKANRVTTIPCDVEMSKWRHLVENFFCKIKEFRRIATRYDKTDTSYRATIHLVARGTAASIEYTWSFEGAPHESRTPPASPPGTKASRSIQPGVPIRAACTFS